MTDRRTAILAHHEAGHLCAAMEVDLDWHTATIEPTDTLNGYVSFDPASFEALDPLQKAFVMYAGGWAVSRHTGRPVAEVLRMDECSHDLPYVEPYLSSPITREWDTTLNRLWPSIQMAAHFLLRDGSLRNPKTLTGASPSLPSQSPPPLAGATFPPASGGHSISTLP